MRDSPLIKTTTFKEGTTCLKDVFPLSLYLILHNFFKTLLLESLISEKPTLLPFIHLQNEHSVGSVPK